MRTLLKQSALNDLILFEPCIDKEATHEKRFCVTAKEFACTHVIFAEVMYIDLEIWETP